MRIPVCKGVVACALVGVAGTLAAATTTTTFDVTATVIPSCSVGATDLGFGTYDPLQPVATDATSDVSVTCTLGTPYTVGLSAGAHADGSTRRMRYDVASYLQYSLYKDSGRTDTWTEASTVADTGTGLSTVHSVFGRIPATQVVMPGAYSDTITVTVYF